MSRTIEAIERQMLIPLKPDTKMNLTNLNGRKATRRRQPQSLLRSRRRSHDPMLVFNMSIFNSGDGWNRIFNRIPQRENVWY